MIDPAHETSLAGEKLISFHEAARESKLTGRKGKPIHECTFHRWATTGSAGVILETVHVGSARRTSREAIARFIAAVSRARGSQAAPSQGPKERERARTKADKVLRAVGL